MDRKPVSGTLRQVLVLTAAGLLAPAAQVLPGRLAEQAGGLAWLAPLLALPVALVWGGLLCSSCREEGMDLAGMARREFGKGFGRGLTLLYIVWIVILTARQWNGTLERMEKLQGVWGWLAAGLTVVLALSMVRKGLGPLCRAAQIFWLALAVVFGGILILALPQIDPVWLAPRQGDGGGLLVAAADCLGVFSSAVLAAALVGGCQRAEGDRRQVLGWIAAVCLLTAAAAVIVVGQLGPALTARLPRAFFVMVQGLGVEGGFARLEAPVSALWLLGDFARFGLFFGAAAALAGDRAGRWTALGVAALGVLLGSFVPMGKGTLLDLFFGGVLPVRLWIRAWFRKKRKEE